MITADLFLKCFFLCTATSTPSEPLILTPDEFAKLTARGVLKFHPPSQDIKPQVTRVVSTPRPAPTILTNNDMDVSGLTFIQSTTQVLCKYKKGLMDDVYYVDYV